ncbi:MAG TPA: NAD(P)-dependent oxidoreductase [Patescibacteria group bacterium]|nr:NAD(P)-dependent oxidoreductase [Patescibacteria group bacterium]
MNIIHFEVPTSDQPVFDKASAIDASIKEARTEYSIENLTIESVSKAAQAEIITIFVNSKVDAATIDALPNLKLLVTRSTGFDHIDVAHAQSKGITVCNIPGYGSRTVAEFTFALMLGLSRKVFGAVEQIKTKNSWDMSQFEGFNLQSKTLGVVGTGRIGLNVAQIAKGFDMKIIAFDAFPNEQKASAYGFTYAANLNALLAASDIVTLHVPATPETHHLINKDNITQFKKGAMLINTARGDVADPEAILAGLHAEILAGVALDVLEGEQDLKEEAELMSANALSAEKLKVLLDDHLLMDNPKVLITPHIAFNTTEARGEIITTTIVNIQSYLSGEPQNIITTTHA